MTGKIKSALLSLILTTSAGPLVWADADEARKKSDAEMSEKAGAEGASLCGDGTVSKFVEDLSAELAYFDKTVGATSLRLVRGLAEGSIDDVANLNRAVLPELKREIKENKAHLKGDFARDLNLMETAVGNFQKEMTGLHGELVLTRQCAQGLPLLRRFEDKVSCVMDGDAVACRDLTPKRDDYAIASHNCHMINAERSFERYVVLSGAAYTILESHRRKKLEYDSRLNPPAHADCRRKSCTGSGLAQKCKSTDELGCVGTRNWAREGLDGLNQQDEKMISAALSAQTPLWNRLDNFRKDEAMALSSSYDAQLKKLSGIIRRKLVLYVAYPDIYDFMAENLRGGLLSLEKAAYECLNLGVSGCQESAGWRPLKTNQEVAKAKDVVRGSHHAHAAMGQLGKALSALKEIEKQEDACAAKKLRLSAKMVWQP